MTLFVTYFVTKCLALGLMCLLINATSSRVVRDWGVRWVRRQCQPLLNSKYLHPVSHSHLCLFNCDTLLIKKSQKDTWHGWDLCHDWVNLFVNHRGLFSAKCSVPTLASRLHRPNVYNQPSQSGLPGSTTSPTAHLPLPSVVAQRDRSDDSIASLKSLLFLPYFQS